MYLLALLIANFVLTTGLPTTHLQTRDDFDPNNTTLTCIFSTSLLNWSGEMRNLCQVGGVCCK